MRLRKRLLCGVDSLEDEGEKDQVGDVSDPGKDYREGSRMEYR